MRGIESIRHAQEHAPAFAVRSVNSEDFGRYYIRGDVFITMNDGKSGEVQERRELKNLVVMDASILVARLLRDPTEPAHGINALAVGTGAGGWDVMAPPAPVVQERALFSELGRKTFTSVQFIDGAGAPTAVPTNVVDYTCTFSESQIVGPLVEMGLMSTLSSNMSVKSPVPAGAYDPTVDLTLYDVLLNALNFAVINKPATSTLTITWRITT